jgi:hypothetical protein
MIKVRHPEIRDLCRRLDVRRVDLVGSAASESFDSDSSDVPVDVVSATNIRNPYFSERVLQTREPLYAA